MINLIPKEEQRKMAKSFYFRLATIYMLAFSLPVLVGVVVLIPSYFLLNAKQNLIGEKTKTQKDRLIPLPEEEVIAAIKDLDEKLSILEKNGNGKFIVSERVINAVLVKKISGVKITDISYDGELLKGAKISIAGTAPSREDLLSFRRALEDDSNFKNVDLPVSNFVRGANIQFSLSLSLSE